MLGGVFGFTREHNSHTVGESTDMPVTSRVAAAGTNPPVPPDSDRSSCLIENGRVTTEQYLQLDQLAPPLRVSS
jgi:hypothetical protein